MTQIHHTWRKGSDFLAHAVRDQEPLTPRGQKSECGMTANGKTTNALKCPKCVRAVEKLSEETKGKEK